MHCCCCSAPQQIAAAVSLSLQSPYPSKWIEMAIVVVVYVDCFRLLALNYVDSVGRLVTNVDSALEKKKKKNTEMEMELMVAVSWHYAWGS